MLYIFPEGSILAKHQEMIFDYDIAQHSQDIKEKHRYGQRRPKLPFANACVDYITEKAKLTGVELFQ